MYTDSTPPEWNCPGQDSPMTTINDTPGNTFSDSGTLTSWLVRLGAPPLDVGLSYRVHMGPADTTAPASPTKVTVFICNHGTILAQASEVTRVSSQMAAVAAAHHAFRELP